MRPDRWLHNDRPPSNTRRQLARHYLMRDHGTKGCIKGKTCITNARLAVTAEPLSLLSWPLTIKFLTTALRLFVSNEVNKIDRDTYKNITERQKVESKEVGQDGIGQDEVGRDEVERDEVEISGNM